MKVMSIVGLTLIILLVMTGCSKPMELGEIYIIDEYDGDNEAIKAFIDSMGYYVEVTADGYSFFPIVIQEGEIIALSEEPWGLLKSDKNRYRIFLYLGDLYGAVFGQEAVDAELEKDSYIFNYYLDVKAKEGALKGKIVGAGASDSIHLSVQGAEAS